MLSTLTSDVVGDDLSFAGLFSFLLSITSLAGVTRLSTFWLLALKMFLGNTFCASHIYIHRSFISLARDTCALFPMQLFGTSLGRTSSAPSLFSLDCIVYLWHISVKYTWASTSASIASTRASMV